MIKIEKLMLEQMTQKTGLKLATCLDLLASGWTYVESIDDVSKWMSPAYQMKEVKREQGTRREASGPARRLRR